MDRGWTNQQLRALCEVVLERAEDVDELAGVAPKLAKMCAWRGQHLAAIGRRLEALDEDRRARSAV